MRRATTAPATGAGAQALAGAQAACDGHACDACTVCRTGACCRRDRPDYVLPELGAWNGPLFGRLGVLALDDAQAECHICAAIRFAQIMNGSFGGRRRKLAVL